MALSYLRTTLKPHQTATTVFTYISASGDYNHIDLGNDCTNTTPVRQTTVNTSASYQVTVLTSES